MADLLIVTLGPIQDLIAAARRTRDLWFGSWLLSELSKATAKAMADECGPEALVFPGIEERSELGRGTQTSVANKIVIRVPDGRAPSAVAKLGETGMRKRLEELRDEAFEQIATPYFERKTAEAQVDDLIEFAWVSAPEHEENGYAQARADAESLLAARKNTRLWNAVPWGTQVPKSSIDGERESVLHEDLFDSDLTPEEIRKGYGVGSTERLCGVGLLKRHGIRKNTQYAHRFLSTGHLAAWPLYRRAARLQDPEFDDIWRRYLDKLTQGGVNLKDQQIYQGPGWKDDSFGRYDGSLLFEGRLADVFEEVPDTGRREKGLRESRIALAAVLKKLTVPTPCPYYAILVADGDRMGKAIERQDTFRKHQELSRALDGFAQAVRSIVENRHGGELVYSGGDDVLAFVPLHRAVACTRELAEEFQRRLSAFPADEEGTTPTLSAGIGISHFMDPLRGALGLAHKAENLAKEERNSLAVIVDKRSGPPIEVAGPWGTLDERLTDYVRMHREDWVPDGAAYELRQLARLLERAEEHERQSLEELVKKEAERILRRKQPGHGAQREIAEKTLAQLLDDIKNLPVGKVADRLVVARLLAQAADEAKEPLPEHNTEENA